jgi:hypothetical protein
MKPIIVTYSNESYIIVEETINVIAPPARARSILFIIALK